MPFEINNLKIGFTTNFYKTKIKIKKIEALALAPLSWLKAVTLLTYALTASASLTAPRLRAFEAP